MQQDNKCLTDEEIAGYLEGTAGPEMRRGLELHLERCRACLSTVASIKKALAFTGGDPFEEVPDRLVKNAIALYPVKGSVFDAVLSITRKALILVDCSSLLAVSIPRPAFELRSTKSAEPHAIVLKKSFEGVDVVFVVEKIADALCNISVTLAGDETAERPDRLRAALFSDGRELASYHLEAGETVFEDIAPGPYIIRISSRGREMGNIALKIT